MKNITILLMAIILMDIFPGSALALDGIVPAGVDVKRVVCRNITTMHIVVDKSGSDIWDCNRLIVEDLDAVTIIIVGKWKEGDRERSSCSATCSGKKCSTTCEANETATCGCQNGTPFCECR